MCSNRPQAISIFYAEIYIKCPCSFTARDSAITEVQLSACSCAREADPCSRYAFDKVLTSYNARALQEN